MKIMANFKWDKQGAYTYIPISDFRKFLLVRKNGKRVWKSTPNNFHREPTAPNINEEAKIGKDEDGNIVYYVEFKPEHLEKVLEFQDERKIL